jgi:redox-sensitive bicupin YhaK (pirin superfamily)
MKKDVFISSQGRRADIGDMIIYRILPNRYSQSVGPFVFLDYLAPQVSIQTEQTVGTGAHPHRGIATLSYILKGEDEHFDSAGHYAKVGSGGIQWMKAGNGIVHDETLVADPNADSNVTQGFQFWINLPAKQKREKPEYMAIAANDVPQKLLEQRAGWIKVIVGNYEELTSRIPNYSDQFLYHICLQADSQFTMPTNRIHEYGVFLFDSDALINDKNYMSGDFIQFASGNGDIEIRNTNNAAMSILLFGGAPYTEPIVAEGPFVMNSYEEIAEAYRDFHMGKYGRIDYKKELSS